MLTVYGLKTCDTCRKARKWLEGEGIEYAWVDVRADGVTKDQIAMWVKTAGWEQSEHDLAWVARCGERRADRGSSRRVDD